MSSTQLPGNTVKTPGVKFLFGSVYYLDKDTYSVHVIISVYPRDFYFYTDRPYGFYWIRRQGTKEWGNDFLLVTPEQGCYGWKVMVSAIPQGEKSSYSLFPGAGAVVTNDWCTTNACMVPGLLGQSDAPFHWYSGRSRVWSSGPAPSFVEIWSWNYFYSHSLPTAYSSRAAGESMGT